MPVRHADIQAFLVEALVGSNQFSDALSALRELAVKAPDWSSRGLVERSLIEKLSHECGVDFDAMWNSGRRKYDRADEDSEDNGVEEDIQEIMD